MLPVFLLLYETVDDDYSVERYAAVAPVEYSGEEADGYGVDWYRVDSVLSRTSAAGDGYTEVGNDTGSGYMESLPRYEEQVAYLDKTGDGMLDLSVQYLDSYEPRYAL